MLQDADTLQVVAVWLMREEAGLKLALLCKACATVVRAADTAEDAGQTEIWLAGRPMWDTQRVNVRIDTLWADGLPGLDRLLKSIAMEIKTAHEYETVKLVFH
jgi:hypothetical protein